MRSATDRVMASACAGQFLFGITLALLGTLFGITAYTDALALDLPRRTLLLVVLFTGQLLWTAAAGRLVDRANGLRVLAAGVAAMAMSLLLIALTNRIDVALAAVALMSLGGSTVNAASNVLVSNVGGARRGPMLNVVGIFCAMGALAVPPLLAGVRTMGDLQLRLGVVAAAGLASAIAHLAQADLAPAPVVRAARERGRRLLLDPVIALLALMLVLDFGSESVLAGWIATYALGAVPGVPATAMVAVYWGALMAGRAVGPAALARVSKLALVALAGVALAAGCIGISLAVTPAALTLTVALAGLAVAPLAPTILSVAGDGYGRSMGVVFGLLLSIGQVGSVALPWIVGRIAEDVGFRAAMLVPAVAGGTVCTVALVLRAKTPASTGAALEAS